MEEQLQRQAPASTYDPAPWTTAGGPDDSYADRARQANHAWLTDSRLADRFRLVAPDAAPVYESMIRTLDLVWECPDDATVNVVGYRCAGCGAGRDTALLAARCRDGL
jgi:hypothetical protein